MLNVRMVTSVAVGAANYEFEHDFEFKSHAKISPNDALKKSLAVVEAIGRKSAEMLVTTDITFTDGAMTGWELDVDGRQDDNTNGISRIMTLKMTFGGTSPAPVVCRTL